MSAEAVYMAPIPVAPFSCVRGSEKQIGEKLDHHCTGAIPWWCMIIASRCKLEPASTDLP